MPIDPSIYRAQEPVPSPMQAVSDIYKLKAQQQQQQIEGLKLGEMQHALQLRTALSKAITETPMVDEEGTSIYDIPTVTKKLAAAGYGAESDDIVKHLGGINTAFRTEQAAKKALVVQGATSLLAGGADPDLTLHFMDLLEKNNSYPKETLDKFRDYIRKNPDKTGTVLRAIVPAQKPERGAPGSMSVDPITGRPIPGSEIAPTPTRANLAMQAAGGDPAKALGLMSSQSEKALQPEDVLIDGKLGKAVFHPDPVTGKGKYTRPGTDEDISSHVTPFIKPTAAQISVNATGNLTDAAMDQAARKYLDSGTLPTLGMGSAAVAARTKIMNRAAELDPNAALARNAATFKADSANLTNLQRTEGTLSAFEQAAGNNLDRFLTLANKIPDTGIPWLNTPVRRLTVNVVGQENMAAINAARDVALREVARVTNNPNLSGALSDNARREVAGLSPENATLPQIKAVVKVLRQDMATVHSSLKEQIANVKKGIGNMPDVVPDPKDPFSIR